MIWSCGADESRNNIFDFKAKDNYSHHDVSFEKKKKKKESTEGSQRENVVFFTSTLIIQRTKDVYRLEIMEESKI